MRALPALSALSLLALAVAACTPAGECRGYNDCPAGQICSADLVCVEDTFDPGTGPIGPNPNPNNRDAGPVAPGGVSARVSTSFLNTPFLQLDPLDPSRALYGEYLEAAGSVSTDSVRAFAVATGAKEATAESLIAMVSGPCQLDSVVDPGVANGELWYNCLRSPGLRIVYDENPLDVTQDEPQRADVWLATSPVSANEYPRRLAAERGGTLRSYQLRNSDGLGNPHFQDTFAAAVIDVVALFPVNRDTAQDDTVLAHVRSDTANELVPLRRAPGLESWDAAGQLGPRTLPDDTHIVWRLGNINASGAATNLNVPNYMTIHPATGMLRFWRYESNQEIQPPTLFEPDTSRRGPAPANTERALIVKSPSGQYLFYARADESRVWRLPLTGGAENDVRFANLESTSFQPTGIIAVDEDTVWVSYANHNQIQRINVDQGGM